MPRYYYPYTSKDTVEQHKIFSVQFLKQHKYLEDGSYKSGDVIWSRNGNETGRISIRVDMQKETPSVRFIYRIRRHGEEEWKDMDFSFNLTSVPCHFGGKRWYFKCGVYKNGEYCGRRVGTLYDGGDYFCCRHCAELSYDSCNENKTYRSGYFRILSRMWKADEYYEKNVKRTHYKGKPTKKYLKYLRMRDDFNEQDVELALRKMSIDLGNNTV